MFHNIPFFKIRPDDSILLLFVGRVYNITPYLEYHPGGIPELMQAAGKDGTHLFDEVEEIINKMFHHW